LRVGSCKLWDSIARLKPRSRMTRNGVGRVEDISKIVSSEK